MLGCGEETIAGQLQLARGFSRTSLPVFCTGERYVGGNARFQRCEMFKGGQGVFKSGQREPARQEFSIGEINAARHAVGR